MSNLIAFFVAIIASIVALSLLLRRAEALPLDYPNERSLHSVPVPRIGGLGLIPAAIVGWLAGMGLPTGANWADALILVAGALVLFVISIRDDRSGLPVVQRLGSHLFVATVLALWLNDSWLFVLIGALAVAWMTNLHNFMDGANGLAGGMAIIGFSTYGLAIPESTGVSSLSFALAGAAAGFLLFNFDPAKIFLGDAGSIPIGFLAGGIGMLGVARGWWPEWFPLVVFSPFVVDASVTLVRRGWRREKVWRGHREHYYQRLVRMGWSHRRLVICEYGLMLAASATALMLLRASTDVRAWGFLSLSVIFLAVMWAIDRRWRDVGGAG